MQLTKCTLNLLEQLFTECRKIIGTILEPTYPRRRGGQRRAPPRDKRRSPLLSKLHCPLSHGQHTRKLEVQLRKNQDTCRLQMEKCIVGGRFAMPWPRSGRGATCSRFYTRGRMRCTTAETLRHCPGEAPAAPSVRLSSFQVGTHQSYATLAMNFCKASCAPPRTFVRKYLRMVKWLLEKKNDWKVLRVELGGGTRYYTHPTLTKIAFFKIA